MAHFSVAKYIHNLEKLLMEYVQGIFASKV